MTTLSILGLLAVPILLIVGLIAVFRKTGTAKKWFKISGGVFVAALIIFIVFVDDSEEIVEEGSTEVKADVVKKEEVSAESKAKEAELVKAKEDKAKRAEEKKAKEDKAKEAEEKKAKENKEHSKLADSFVNDIGLITDEVLTLSDESYDFIVKNHSLFPALNAADIEKAKSKADSAISAKHLNKNAQPYFQKIATFSGQVISVEEGPAEVSDTISLTHVLDNQGQSHQVFMYKGTGEILEGDTVRFWGVPVGSSSFENVSGGATNVQVFLGSHME